MHEVVGRGLRCVVDAAHGGRIVSLWSGGGADEAGIAGDGAGDGDSAVVEWLAPSYPSEQPGAGVPFVRAGMGGWDEVAPSVQADVLADGTVVADHGDVWNVPWTVASASSDALVMEVELASMPVTLRRTIRATDAGLRFEYSATTDAMGEYPLLWCAHPQFSAGPRATLTLGLAGRDIRSELIEEYPNRGARRELPVQSLHATLAGETSVKAFLPPGVVADSATLNVGRAQSLQLSWDPTALPYLGLFWDNGEFATDPVLAIEPATGWGDSLSEAVASARVLSVAAGSPLGWHLDVAVVSAADLAPLPAADLASLPTAVPSANVAHDTLW